MATSFPGRLGSPVGSATLSMPWLATLAMVAAAVGIQLFGVPNHDVAWILTGTERLLDGGRFGRDIVDVNPPLAWWIFTVPVFLADAGGWPLYPVFVLFIAALCFASGRLAVMALRHGPDGHVGRRVMIGGVAVLLLAPGYDYGQREHLLLIAALPYCVAASVACRGRPVPSGLGIAVGVFAAMGLCLKPYFLLIPCALELWVWARTGRLAKCVRAETLALGMTGCFYVVAVFIWAPDYLQFVVPDAVAGYWAYEGTPAQLLRAVLSTLLPMACAVAVLIGTRRGKPTPLVSQAMLIAAFGAGAAAILQYKGWHYHFLPALGLAAIGCITAFWSRGGPAAVAALGVALTTTFGAAVTYLASSRTADGTVTHVEQLAALFKEKAAGRPVFAVMTSPRDIHPAILLSGAQWGAAACCMYQLPAIIREREQPDVTQVQAARDAATRQLATTLRGLNAHPPALILVDDRPDKLGFGDTAFDYLGILDRQPGYAVLFARYRPRAAVAGFRVFERTD